MNDYYRLKLICNVSVYLFVALIIVLRRMFFLKDVNNLKNLNDFMNKYYKKMNKVFKYFKIKPCVKTFT